MRPEARAGWCKVHRDPWVAWWCHALGFTLGVLVTSIGLLAGVPWFMWYLHSGAIVSCAIVLPVHLVGVWICGPAFNTTNIFALSSITNIICCTPAAFLITAGPIRLAIFRNRIISLCVSAVGTFAYAFSSFMAPMPSAFPKEPMTSLTTPLMAAANLTSHFMNAFTDAAIVRPILEQARSPCYWFGDLIHCARYRLGAAIAAILCGVHFTCTLARLFLESNASDHSRAKRAAAVALAIACVAEVGNVSVALLKLASDTQLPRRDMSAAAAAQFRQDAAFTVTSCVLSVGAVILYVVGFKRMLQLLRAGACRIRESLKSVKRRVVPVSHAAVPPQAAAASCTSRPTSSCELELDRAVLLADGSDCGAADMKIGAAASGLLTALPSSAGSMEQQEHVLVV
eukprot:jgi/Ulvmu1/8631/UM046_0034.1